MANASKRKIEGAVSIGDHTYVAGEEDALAELLDAKQVKRLTEAGAISGWTDEDEDSDKLPKIDELDAHLASLTTVEEVRALKKRDDRVTAAPKYEARIAELKAAK